MYIFVKGNKAPNILTRDPIKRAFKPTGLKVIFVFLRNPDLVRRPYRDIAKAANVALGSVSWIIRDLKKRGYLLDMGKRGYKLTKKEDLFNRWLIEYPEKLRPKLLLGNFKSSNKKWLRKNLHPLNAQWGSEVAAAKIIYEQYLVRHIKEEN